jgi:hypothetical protein
VVLLTGIPLSVDIDEFYEKPPLGIGTLSMQASLDIRLLFWESAALTIDAETLVRLVAGGQEPSQADYRRLAQNAKAIREAVRGAWLQEGDTFRRLTEEEAELVKRLDLKDHVSNKDAVLSVSVALKVLVKLSNGKTALSRLDVAQALGMEPKQQQFSRALTALIPSAEALGWRKVNSHEIAFRKEG